MTRLYPFGENDLDIASVNGGVKYLNNNSFIQSVLTGFYRNQRISDAQELMDEATKELAKICKPRHTYRVGMVDLRTLPEYSHEDFTLGDMVDVVDPDLGGARVRIVRHRYNLFMPWVCELEIGEPEERLAVQLKESFDVSKYVGGSIRPNTGLNNLLKGIMATFATTVNGASGAFDIVDGVATWRELDVDGEQTGKMVRVSPGGIAVTTNGGVNWDTIMTADGIIARRFFAIESEDGFTKLMDLGLKVFDNLGALRVHIGQYDTGKFGLYLLDPQGSATILDDNGILQSWQDSRADNVDATHGLVLNVYLPAETRSIKKALLRFKLLAFRAYETGAASGGGTSTSTASGGGVSTSTASGGGTSTSTLSGGGQTSGIGSYTLGGNWIPSDWMDWVSDHTHGGTTSWSLPSIPSGYDHYHDYRSMNGAGGHAHGRDTRHDHYVSSHTHDFSVPSHTHDLSFGIYEGATANNIKVIVNGVDRTSALGGGTGFTSDQDALNIGSYLTPGTWNTVELRGTGLGRIDASIFIQSMMGV